jgi:hypothetical protein
MSTKSMNATQDENDHSSGQGGAAAILNLGDHIRFMGTVSGVKVSRPADWWPVALRRLSVARSASFLEKSSPSPPAGQKF